MILKTDLEALHLALDKQPADWDTRLVLADLYEETGQEDRAIFQRWLVKHKKRPWLAINWRAGVETWCWEGGRGFRSALGKLGGENINLTCFYFDTRQLAEDALFATVTRLGYAESERLLKE